MPVQVPGTPRTPRARSRRRALTLVPLVAAVSVLAGVVGTSLMLLPGRELVGVPADVSPAPSPPAPSLPVPSVSGPFPRLYAATTLRVSTDCSIGRAVDFDAPQPNSGMDVADIWVLPDCGSRTIEIVVDSSAVFGSAGADSVTRPQQCVDALRTAPATPGFRGSATAGETYCLITWGSQAGRHNVVTFTVVDVTKGGVVDLRAMAWTVV